jgi:hypothetical protein
MDGPCPVYNLPLSACSQGMLLTIIAAGLGFVKVDNPEDYDNLPTPLAEYNGTVFTTSMTHQLHCLVHTSLLDLFARCISSMVRTIVTYRRTACHNRDLFRSSYELEATA